MTYPVCHVSTMTRWGGVEMLLLDLLTQASSSRFSHFLLATSSAQEILAPLTKSGVKCFQPRRHFHYDPSAIRQMSLWMRSQKIAISHTYNAVPNAWGGIATLLSGTAHLVCGEHGTAWSVRPPLSWINRLMYRLAKLVIVNSEASKKMVCARFRVPEEKVRVVYNAIPAASGDAVASAHSLFGSESDFIVGSVGRLVPMKGYSVFVEAAAEVLRGKQKVHFVLVGDGPEKERLQRLACDLGIENHFTFTGWRPDARALVQHFDLFVSTSLHESFGNVLIEAALAHKAVIAPGVDGIPEAVVAGETGLLLEPKESFATYGVDPSALPRSVIIDGQLSTPKMVRANELAQAINYLINNRDLCLQLGEAGYARATERFTLQSYQSHLEDIYGECLDNV